MAPEVDEYTIALHGIRFRAKHGVSASERNLPQDFQVELEVTLPVARLPATDRYRDVLDYDQLAALVVQEGSREPCRLLETLARRIIARTFEATPAVRVRVSITKSHPPTTHSVQSVAVQLSGKR